MHLWKPVEGEWLQEVMQINRRDGPLHTVAAAVTAPLIKEVPRGTGWAGGCSVLNSPDLVASSIPVSTTR